MTTPTTEYTYEEIAKHNTDESRWIAVDGNVYDVTDFINHHPGGRKPFEKYAGTNATARFKSIKKHTNPQVQTILKTLCIGKVKPGEVTVQL